MPRRLLSQALSLLLATGGAAAPAQEAPPPDDERPDARESPLLTDNSLLREGQERTTRPEAEGALLPSRPPGTSQVVPNQPPDPARLALADGATAWANAGTLLPEGTFVVRRVGEVVRLRTGGLAFLPAANPGEAALPAMPLLPCEVYGRLAALLNEDDRGLWIAITGEVFQYHGRNYLLPTAFASEGAPAPPEAAAGPPEPPSDAGAAQADQPAADSRIDELVRELEAQRRDRRGIDTAFAEEPAAGEAVPGGPRVEGRMLLSRRARMVRGPGGGWVVTLDNDPDGPSEDAAALPERLHLLPGRLVGQMERIAERRGEAWTFEISGNLFRHADRVYIVPRLFVSLPADEIEPLQ